MRTMVAFNNMLNAILCLIIIQPNSLAFTFETTNSIGTRLKNVNPAVISSSRKHRNLSLQMMAAAPKTPPVKIPNLMKQLPWVVERETQRENNRLRYEASKYYRELGVAEDATYEEITDAVTKLEERYEGDIKSQIKVGIAKDKIQQIRYKQRTAGLYLESSDAKAGEWLAKSAKSAAQKSSKKDNKERTPGLFGGTLQILKPDKRWKKRCWQVYGFQALAGCISTKLAEIYLPIFSFFWMFTLMNQRGRKDSDDELEGGRGGYMGRRMSAGLDGKGLIAIVLTCTTMAVSTMSANSFIMLVPTLKGNAIEHTLFNLVVQGINGLGTAYLFINKKGVQLSDVYN